MLPLRIKNLLHSRLPDSVYSSAEAIFQLRNDFVWTAKLFLAHRRPDALVYFGEAPGDDLLCTTVIREMQKRKLRNVWMMSQNPDIFKHNEDVTRTFPICHQLPKYIRAFNKDFIELEYAAIDRDNDKSVAPSRHIIAEMCYRSGIRGSISLRPYLYLMEEERVDGKWAKGMIAVQSSGLSARFPMLNKQWFPGRFQDVVSHLLHDFQFVQIGSKSDPALDGAIDLRGKTTIRQTGAILANCKLYLGNVGFLMHLARAVDCPAVIIFGGRESPEQSGYSANTNLYTNLPCAPCWQWNTCEYDRKCMHLILSEQVIEAICQKIKHPSPLTTDVVRI